RFPSRGKGILIGQPDTGIAEHQEVDRAALDLDRAADILDGDKDPTDPLIPGTANPGHGTGTASVVISREAGVMVGSAPEATLVPIRCTTDVKIFDGTPVAAAIEHATRGECDVTTIGLAAPARMPYRRENFRGRAGGSGDRTRDAGGMRCHHHEPRRAAQSRGSGRRS